MFIRYGSLLCVGSDAAAFVRPLPLFLMPVSPAFVITEGQLPERSIVVPRGCGYPRPVPNSCISKSQAHAEDVNLEKR